MVGPTHRFWTSFDGLRLHAADYQAVDGEAKLPVVCLHGLTRNARDFEDLADHLAARGRRVVAADVRGRGQSDRSGNPATYHPKIYARDTLAMLDSLSIERAIFVGTSMGGLITMAVAAKRPKAVAAAVLNDVGPEVGPKGIERILAYAASAPVIDSWDQALAFARETNGSAQPEFTDADWDRFTRRWFRDENGHPVLDYDPAIGATLTRPPPRWTRLVAWWLFRRLARSRPVLLVRGAKSDVITAAIADKMSARAPAMDVAIVPNVGHAPTLAEPTAIAAIDRFLDRLP